MARKRYKPEEIVAKLRQVDVLVSQGQGMTEAIRQIGVSEVTYYRWRQEFGGLKIEQVKRKAQTWTHKPDAFEICLDGPHAPRGVTGRYSGLASVP
jgi:transposase